MLCLRASVSHPARPARDLQSPVQRWRRPPGSLGVRRRSAMRPDREEALLPRLAGVRRADLRHARLRFPLSLLPELGHVAGLARPGLRHCRRIGPPDIAGRARGGRCPYGRPGHRLFVQRAADHLRVGAGRLRGGPARRPGDCLCVERQRHPGGSGVPAAVGDGLQSRSEDDARQGLPPAGGSPRSRVGDDPRNARGRLLGRSGHLDHSGIQRQHRRADGCRSFPGLGFARYPVARHGLSQRLQDDGPRQHHGLHVNPRR